MTTALTTEARPATAARATSRGVRPHNMDAAEVFTASTGVVAGAVVDSIGNDADGREVMRLMAQTAVRIGVSKEALAGVPAAAAVIEDPGTGDYRPDGVVVLAVTEPGEPTALAWVGDSHAYGWDGSRLRRRTDPHTMGAYLRRNGNLDLGPVHDNWVRVSLATATYAGVAPAEAPAGELVVLLTDDLDRVPVTKLEALVDQRQDDPRALADAIVAVAREDAAGYRDDATALVLTPR